MDHPGTHATASAPSGSPRVSFDTSGAVSMHPGDGPDSDLAVWWSDLSPFEQGYVEAMAASLGYGDSEERAAIRAKRGFICNWTGGHCPSGCGSPCSYEHRDAVTDKVTARQDYNRLPRFSDLHPEALALILRDCATYESEARSVGLWSGTPAQGGVFWRWRQSVGSADFAPLTPYLSDDGQVCLREGR